MKNRRSSQGRTTVGRFQVAAFWLSLGFCFAVEPQAKAGFIGAYALSDFTLVNTNADGSVTTPDGGKTAILTGGNNGSLMPGTTDLVTVAVGPSVIQFQWFYSSMDTPTFDFAGYLLNNTFFPLADTDGQSGTAMFPVSLGTQFGFRVGTVDNSGEPGILTVSSSVPEPGTAPIMFILTVATMLTRRRNRTNEARE